MELDGLRIKRCVPLADKLRFTVAHSADAYRVCLWSRPHVSASFWCLIALALQLQTLSTKTSPRLLGKTILVRTIAVSAHGNK